MDVFLSFILVKRTKMTTYKDWEKGDRVILNGSRLGTLITKPKYETGVSFGLFFADIRWDDGLITKGFNVCNIYLINRTRE